MRRKVEAARGRHLRLVSQLRARGITDARILEAFSRVPRHLFVEEALADKAYEDLALPIGERQTISQPFVVASMLVLLAAGPEERILEIGTGSGYQTALLAHLAAQVHSMERLAGLARTAHSRIASLGLSNVHIKNFDGTYGWRDRAPFHGIIVAASAPRIPTPLADQLAEGGRLIIPVGDARGQVLMRVRREGRELIQQEHGSCLFVPLIGRFGHEESEAR